MKKDVLTLEEIRSELQEICKDSSVRRIWIFGSYARNEADSESDLDLLVDLEKALDIERFDSIRDVKIDLMPLESFNHKIHSDLRFNKNFVERVLNERILIYEKERN